MCGTLKRSRTMRSPLRGRSVRRCPWPWSVSRSDLKYLERSRVVTWLNNGVRPSYILAWLSALGGTGKSPHSPDGTMLSAVDAKSFAAATPGRASVQAHASSASLLISPPSPSVGACQRPSAPGTLTHWLVGQPAFDHGLETRVLVVARHGLLYDQTRPAAVQLERADLVVEPRLVPVCQAPAHVRLTHAGAAGKRVGYERRGPRR